MVRLICVLISSYKRSANDYLSKKCLGRACGNLTNHVHVCSLQISDSVHMCGAGSMKGEPASQTDFASAFLGTIFLYEDGIYVSFLFCACVCRFLCGLALSVGRASECY